MRTLLRELCTSLLVFSLLLLLLGPSAGWARSTPIADVTVAGTATLVRAANASRTVLSCTNNNAAVHVRWGNSAVTATQGQRILAGLAVQITDREAIFMISEGASVVVSCTEQAR